MLHKEALWPSGQRFGLAIWQSQVESRSDDFAGFVLGSPEFKSSATLVNSQLVGSYQLGFFNPVMLYLNDLFLSI